MLNSNGNHRPRGLLPKVFLVGSTAANTKRGSGALQGRSVGGCGWDCGVGVWSGVGGRGDGGDDCGYAKATLESWKTLWGISLCNFRARERVKKKRNKTRNS